MSGRRTVEDWRRAVYRSRTLSDHAKVVLLLLGDRMRADLKVSVPRATIAREVGKSERGVTRSIAEAHELQFLDTVVRGRKHVTAVYSATFPDSLSGTHAVPLRDQDCSPESSLSGTYIDPLRSDQNCPPESAESGAQRDTRCPTISRADLSVSPTDRNVGSEEQAEATPVRFPLTACEVHEHLCPSYCINHPANREASA